MTSKKKIEYWFDKNHTGALRVLDYENNKIFGCDPKEKDWIVSFTVIDKNKISVDFHSKDTHRGHKIMIASYSDRRNSLNWPDGNVWKRIRVNPEDVLNTRKKYTQKNKSNKARNTILG